VVDSAEAEEKVGLVLGFVLGVVAATEATDPKVACPYGLARRLAEARGPKGAGGGGAATCPS
jgi:hypothetical protein